MLDADLLGCVILLAEELLCYISMEKWIRCLGDGNTDLNTTTVYSCHREVQREVNPHDIFQACDIKKKTHIVYDSIDGPVN